MTLEYMCMEIIRDYLELYKSGRVSLESLVWISATVLKIVGHENLATRVMSNPESAPRILEELTQKYFGLVSGPAVYVMNLGELVKELNKSLEEEKQSQ